MGGVYEKNLFPHLFKTRISVKHLRRNVVLINNTLFFTVKLMQGC